MIVYKIPVEIAYTKKGLRDGCHILMAGYRSEIREQVNRTFGITPTENPISMTPSSQNNVNSTIVVDDNNNTRNITKQSQSAYLKKLKFKLQ